MGKSSKLKPRKALPEHYQKSIRSMIEMVNDMFRQPKESAKDLASKQPSSVQTNFKNAINGILKLSNPPLDAVQLAEILRLLNLHITSHVKVNDIHSQELAKAISAQVSTFIYANYDEKYDLGNKKKDNLEFEIDTKQMKSDFDMVVAILIKAYEYNDQCLYVYFKPIFDGMVAKKNKNENIVSLENKKNAEAAFVEAIETNKLDSGKFAKLTAGGVKQKPFETKEGEITSSPHWGMFYGVIDRAKYEIEELKKKKVAAEFLKNQIEKKGWNEDKIRAVIESWERLTEAHKNQLKDGGKRQEIFNPAQTGVDDFNSFKEAINQLGNAASEDKENLYEFLLNCDEFIKKLKSASNENSFKQVLTKFLEDAQEGIAKQANIIAELNLGLQNAIKNAKAQIPTLERYVFWNRKDEIKEAIYNFLQKNKKLSAEKCRIIWEWRESIADAFFGKNLEELKKQLKSLLQTKDLTKELKNMTAVDKPKLPSELHIAFGQLQDNFSKTLEHCKRDELPKIERLFKSVNETYHGYSDTENILKKTQALIESRKEQHEQEKQAIVTQSPAPAHEEDLSFEDTSNVELLEAEVQNVLSEYHSEHKSLKSELSKSSEELEIQDELTLEEMIDITPKIARINELIEKANNMEDLSKAKQEIENIKSEYNTSVEFLLFPVYQNLQNKEEILMPTHVKSEVPPQGAADDSLVASSENESQEELEQPQQLQQQPIQQPSPADTASTVEIDQPKKGDILEPLSEYVSENASQQELIKTLGILFTRLDSEIENLKNETDSNKKKDGLKKIKYQLVEAGIKVQSSVLEEKEKNFLSKMHKVELEKCNSELKQVESKLQVQPLQPAAALKKSVGNKQQPALAQKKILVINAHGSKLPNQITVAEQRTIVTAGKEDDSYTVSFDKIERHLEEVSCKGKLWPIIDKKNNKKVDWHGYSNGARIHDVSISPFLAKPEQRNKALEAAKVSPRNYQQDELMQQKASAKVLFNELLKKNHRWGKLTEPTHDPVARGALAIIKKGKIEILEGRKLRSYIKNYRPDLKSQDRLLFYCDKELGKVKILGNANL